jgi:EmrB/QacA subfamily drug resistance transporter
MLTAALLIPASGWFADRFGVRRVFVFAIFLFTFGSLFCAAAQDLSFLVFSRILQGVGGALMAPVGRLIILRVYPKHDLVGVLSFVTLPGLFGPLVGPVAGGFFVQYASWHWIFLINLPVGLLGIILALRCMPDIPSSPGSHFDFAGFILFGLSMVLITLAMEGFGELHLPGAQSTLLCVSGLAFQAFYWLRATRTPEPLFRPSLFSTRSFSVGILGNLFARLGTGAMPFLIPIFLQVALGFSPLKAGLTMAPIALFGIIGKRLINPVLHKTGFRLFLTLNNIVQGAIFAGFFFITENTPYPLLLGWLSLQGIVNSMQFTALNSIVLIDLPPPDASAGNSMLSVVMQVANMSGVAMSAAILAGFTGLYLSPGPEEIRRAFHYTFAAVGFITALSSFIFSQVPPEAGEGD